MQEFVSSSTFHRAIEGIEAALARIGANAYATSALSRMTATAVDLGEKPAVLQQ